MAAAGILIALFIAFAGFYGAPFLRNIDNYWYDTLLHQSPGTTSPEVTLVDIDDHSLSLLGQWPWPRYRLAALIRKISDMEPTAMGMDIILPEPDRTALMNIQKNFLQDFGLNIGFKGVPPSLTDNDGYLGEVLRETGTVGARYFYFDRTGNGAVCSVPDHVFYGAVKELMLHRATGVLCNIPRIETSIAYRGFINNKLDDDGLLRRVPMLIRYQDGIHPNLALATFMKFQAIDMVEIKKDALGYFMVLGSHSIPITRNGYALLRFSRPGCSHQSISAVDILNNSVDAEAIQGKIIFIGTSAVGLDDLHNTTFDSNFPGLEVHGVVMDNILRKSSIREPVWREKLIFFLTLSTGVFMSLLFFLSSGPLALFLGTVGVMSGFLLLSKVAFQSFQFFVSPVQPVVVTALLFSFFSTLCFALEKRRSYLWYRMLSNVQQVTMETMATIVETRDSETGEHIQRTQQYAVAIAEYLLQSKLFTETVNRRFIDILYISVPLHDIGKVGIPDRILLKPGCLTSEEFHTMRLHAEYGKRIIAKAAAKIQGENFLEIAGEVTATHHEKWNGKGYPEGLAGEKIPLSGRIMAIADVYDALISKRVYKAPFPHPIALEMIRQEAGISFDPILVDAFIAIEDQVKEIASRFKDVD